MRFGADAAMHIEDLPTPAILIDRERLVANLDRGAERAKRTGVVQRPHAKTHKCVEIARLQMDRGAVGLTVSTLDEAEAFAEAGFKDLVLATPIVGDPAFERISALLETGLRFAISVDTKEGAALTSDWLSSRGQTLDVLIEVDTGHHRNGIAWDDPKAVEKAIFVAERPTLNLRGVLTHGNAYQQPRDGGTPVGTRVRAMEEERDRILTFASRLGEAGLLDPKTAVVSIGATPNFSVFENTEVDGFRITEMRAGNYVFHDRQQVILESATPEDCAATVLARVISKRRSGDGTERVIVDAGKKILTTDRGLGIETFGAVLYSPRSMKENPHARLNALSEQHGWIDTPGGSIYDVGELVQIVPNHVCVTVATQPRLYVVEGDEVVETWERVN